jgi:hypothetical protein
VTGKEYHKKRQNKDKKITKCERKSYGKMCGRDIGTKRKMTEGRERNRSENNVKRNI